jgi:hypothetical protein
MAPIALTVQAQTYDTWMIVVYEHVIRAVTTRLASRELGAKEGEAAPPHENRAVSPMGEALADAAVVAAYADTPRLVGFADSATWRRGAQPLARSDARIRWGRKSIFRSELAICCRSTFHIREQFYADKRADVFGKDQTVLTTGDYRRQDGH